MEESNRKRFSRINEDVRMVVDKVALLGWTTAGVVGAIGLALFYFYVFVKGVVEDVSGHSGDYVGPLQRLSVYYLVMAWREV
uniref:Uncharacterized protein n=2 Tax=Aegilops tauschii TaxID=37682 RepID=A0A453QBW4_AEGTS